MPDAGIDPRVLYCAMGQGCLVIAPRTFTACVSSTDGPPLEVQACIAAAADCAAARACAWDATHPSLCAFGAQPFCDGDVAYACDGVTTTTAQSDCALVGEQCVAGAAAAQCARGTCSKASAVAACVGTVAGYCAPPFLVGDDCAQRDSTCAGSDGGATCRGNGADCIIPRCDGTTLVDCLDGKEARLPCPDGERCIPASTYCRRGLLEKLDCRALGFADCQPSPTSGCVVSVADGGVHPLTDAFQP
jgi:hypothetical protein